MTDSWTVAEAKAKLSEVIEQAPYQPDLRRSRATDVRP